MTVDVSQIKSINWDIIWVGQFSYQLVAIFTFHKTYISKCNILFAAQLSKHYTFKYKLGNVFQLMSHLLLKGKKKAIDLKHKLTFILKWGSLRLVKISNNSSSPIEKKRHTHSLTHSQIAKSASSPNEITFSPI